MVSRMNEPGATKISFQFEESTNKWTAGLGAGAAAQRRFEMPRIRHLAPKVKAALHV
jgi:hypothetical protein